MLWIHVLMYVKVVYVESCIDHAWMHLSASLWIFTDLCFFINCLGCWKQDHESPVPTPESKCDSAFHNDDCYPVGISSQSLRNFGEPQSSLIRGPPSGMPSAHRDGMLKVVPHQDVPVSHGDQLLSSKPGCDVQSPSWPGVNKNSSICPIVTSPESLMDDCMVRSMDSNLVDGVPSYRH
jgi:hypothetical protein